MGAFVAHTELAKKESTAMMTKQDWRISKLDESERGSGKVERNDAKNDAGDRGAQPAGQGAHEAS